MAEKAPQVSFYAVKVTGGQEITTALMIEERIKLNNLKDIKSIIIPPQIKGYVVIEATGLHAVKLITSGLRHVRGIVHGLVPIDDVKKYVAVEVQLPTFKPGDVVEIIAGPFRGMQAQVVRVEEGKKEVTLYILESSFPLQVTIPIDQVREVKR